MRTCMAPLPAAGWDNERNLLSNPPLEHPLHSPDFTAPSHLAHLCQKSQATGDSNGWEGGERINIALLIWKPQHILLRSLDTQLYGFSIGSLKL